MGLTSSVPNSILQPGVCTSTTRPAAPYEGQVVYETDTNKTLFYNGTAWVILNDPNAVSIDASGNVTFSNDATVSGDLTVTGNMTSANQGLVFIKSQTIDSGVSSVTVSDVFSATYDSYKIIFDLDTFSVNNAGIQLRLGATTNIWYGKFGVTAWNGSLDISNIGAASVFMPIGNTTTTNRSVSSIMELVRPYVAARTQAYGHHYGNGYVGNYQASEESTNSHSYFSVAPSAGTMTGGKIQVYGYAQ